MRFLLAFVCALFPATLAAQPIWGSPQKAAYASPAEYPTPSGQCHWKAPNVNATPGIPSHLHVDMSFPIYGVTVRDPFTVRFSVTLFNTAGRIVRIAGVRLKSYTLDNGATVPLHGNPNGVVTWTGTATFDPQGISALPLRGWMMYALQGTVYYDNNDRLYSEFRLPRYSLIDPLAPETGSGNIVYALCQIEDASDPIDGRWGLQYTQFTQFLPVLGPLSPEFPWPVKAGMYNYAPALGGLPVPGTGELWLDPDLHNGDPGTLLHRVTGPNNSPSATSLTFSLPASLSDGPHRLMYAWRRPNVDGSKELTSIFVMPVTVGPGGVPPPSGTPPPPPPPPPPVDRCIADPLIVPPSSAFGWPADVTRVLVTQPERPECPAIEVKK